MTWSTSAATASSSATAGQPSLDVFVARQPIFDRKSELFGYELLFRSGLENQFGGADHDQASLAVIANSFFIFGIEALIGRGRAFINFARSTLINDYAYALPKDRLIIEVLETVEPDSQVIEACERLKAAGYLIALDDFDQRKRGDQLLRLADIIKIDFLATDREQRETLVHELAPFGVSLLAEKVETREHFREARELGFSYMQGYFFARPEIQVGRRTPGFKANRLEIIRLLHEPDPDLATVEEQFKRDPALSYKLLRYLNSAAFGLRHPIRTVRRAVTYLGQAGLRAWATVIVLADLGADQPMEVVVTSVVRGRFCELIGRELGLEDEDQDLFLLGLFSLIDVLTGRTLADVLQDLPLTDNARAALLGKENCLRKILDLVRAYERARWQEAERMIAALDLGPTVMPGAYVKAVEWGNRVRHLR